MAEYKKPYEIKQRTVTDLDDEGRSSGEIQVVGWRDEEQRGGDPEWGATIRYKLDYSGVKFTSITLWPTGDDIPSSLWKRFPLGEIRRYLRVSFVENPSFTSAGALLHDFGQKAMTEQQEQWLREQKRLAEEAAEVLRTSKVQRGPGRKNDETWRAITDLYRYCVRTTADHRSIYKRMVDELDKRQDLRFKRDEETMKWMVERARDYGWLTRPGRGKVGGKKGPRYIEWEKEQNK